jgi:ATP-dependent Clp protease adapter protein ClpS
MEQSNSNTTTVNTPPETKPLKMWKVLVHNDDVNTYIHVIKCLMQILRMDPHMALVKTTEVDKNGFSIVEVTHKERAELLRDQLVSLSLTCTIEPD